MKKVLSFLLLANLVAPAWCMDRATGSGSADGGASSAASASTPLVFDICTSDGKVVQLDHRFITACGFFRDFIALNHGSIPEDQRIWRDFPIQSRILQILLQLIDNPQRALPLVNHLSLMELNELHEAANLLVVAPDVQALIANRIVQELPHGLSTLNKADFNTFFHNTVIHLLSRNSAARSALALQLAQHGVRPAVTDVPTRHNITNICFAPEGTLAYITAYADHDNLYLYDRNTKFSTLIRDSVWRFRFAPDGTLAYTTYPDNHLYLYDRNTKFSTRIIRDYIWDFNFSPDGTLAYITGDTDHRSLHLYDRNTKASTFIRRHVFDFSFAPDGTLACKLFDALYLYDRPTHKSTHIQDRVCDFSFAPDGTLAYRTNDTDHNSLYLYDRSTKVSTLIRDHVCQLSFAPDGTLAIVSDYGQLQLLDFTHGLDTAQQLFMLYILANVRAGHPVTFTPQEIVALETRLYRTLDGTMPSNTPANPQTTVDDAQAVPPPPPTETWKEFIQSEYRLHHASLLDGLPAELRTHVHISETGAGAGASDASILQLSETGAGAGAADTSILQRLLRLVWR